MSTRELIQPSWRVLWQTADDDAYSAWFNAEQRCGDALRAWRDADSHRERASAYLAYCFAIDVEERAAARLQRACSTSRLAA
jgi:hypothetical protein